MSAEFLIALLSEHGPWVLLVFYLLWRDLQKDQATRAVLDRNSAIHAVREVLGHETGHMAHPGDRRGS